MSSSFRVKGELSLDGSKFQAGLSQAEIAAGRFANTVSRNLGGKLAALFSVGAMAGLGRKIFEFTDELTNASDRLGVSIEKLQVLRQAAKDAGGDLGTITSAFEAIDRSRKKALEGGLGGVKANQAFARFGITDSDLRGMSQADIFAKIGKAAGGMSQSEVGPLLKNLRMSGEAIGVLTTDLDELEKKMQDFGLIMEAKTARQLDALGDQFDALSKILIVGFAPALLQMSKAMVQAAIWISGKIAGISGTVAGAGAGMSTGAQIWGHIKIAYGAMLADLSMMSAKDKKSYLDSVATLAGFNLKAGGQAGAAAEKPYKDLQEAIDKLLEQAGKQKPPGTGGAFPWEPPAPKSSPGKAVSDQLTSIGNFLGAGKTDSMQRIAQRQLKVQEDMLGVLKDIAAGDSGDMGFGGAD